MEIISSRAERIEASPEMRESAAKNFMWFFEKGEPFSFGALGCTFLIKLESEENCRKKTFKTDKLAHTYNLLMQEAAKLAFDTGEAEWIHINCFQSKVRPKVKSV
jgi:hypothetical protein